MSVIMMEAKCEPLSRCLLLDAVTPHTWWSSAACAPPSWSLHLCLKPATSWPMFPWGLPPFYLPQCPLQSFLYTRQDHFEIYAQILRFSKDISGPSREGLRSLPTASTVKLWSVKVWLLLVGTGSPRTGEGNALEDGGTVLTPYNSLKESCRHLPEHEYLPLNACCAIEHPSPQGEPPFHSFSSVTWNYL